MYKKFTQIVGEIAQNWPKHHEEIEKYAKQGSNDHGYPYHANYSGAIDALSQEIRKLTTDGRITDLIKNPVVTHGLKVTMRFYDNAASSAASSSLSQEQIYEHLRTESLKFFGKMASMTAEFNKEVEGKLNILSDSTNTTESLTVPEIYIWNKDGKLEIPILDIQSALYRFGDSYDESRVCPAHKSHELGNIALSLLEICNRDDQLFADTFKKIHTEQEQDIAVKFRL